MLKINTVTMTREIHAILFGTSLTTEEFYEVTDKLLNLFSVSQRYTIEDIEKCVENWGLCKVEKEYIEKFLNGG